MVLMDQSFLHCRQTAYRIGEFVQLAINLVKPLLDHVVHVHAPALSG